LENGVRPKTSTNTQGASDIALLYMAYLAANDEKLGQFCNLSGLGQSELTQRLLEPAFQGFLLDFLLQDESELMAFASEHNLRPETIMVARSKLPGFSHDL
jgi:Protein of unknown function (DUF3572)